MIRGCFVLGFSSAGRPERGYNRPMRAGLHRRLTLVTLALAASASAVAAYQDESLAAAEAAWARRTVGGSGLKPAPEPVAEAIAGYRAVLADRPDDLELRWKLMRALHYQGDYVLERREDKLAVFADGRDLGEGSLDRIAVEFGGRAAFDSLEPAAVVDALRGRAYAAPTYFWTCVHWGLWGRERGRLAAAREGVANRVRDFADIIIGLDDSYEAAGGYRIKGRLHFEAPRIPFITGWVDKSEVLVALQRAVEIAPEHPLSQLYLAEAIYDSDRARRPEAIERLRHTIEAGPRPDRPFEDARTLVTARALLEAWTR